MGKELLFEIGTEEIPSAYLPGMLAALKERAGVAFAGARLDFDGLTVCGTPRRLVLHVADLAERQRPLTEEVLGPPVKAAFDADGNPTKAALGFARTNSVEVPDLGRRETNKGERLMFLREDAGLPCRLILPLDILVPLILGLPSPKSMRWAEGHLQFVRPIHWILALYGGELISTAGLMEEVGPPIVRMIPSFGNKTRGHRFMGPAKPFEVKSFDDYLKKLSEHFVEPILDDGEGGGRVPMVREGVLAAAGVAGAELAAGPEAVERLVEKVAHLVEWPFPVACAFAEKFLDLPEEVIIATLEVNQRCFALREKGGGGLLPAFVGVSNTEARDMDVVRRGYERVVRARLEDAEFYWSQDLKTSLDEMAGRLKGVVYHLRLGTSWEKVERFRALAGWLGERLFPEEAAARERVDEAARLCKADLTSGMVGEFPELQGLMGERYAERVGLDPAVSRAIFEHYLPRGERDAPPAGDAGALVGLADRMDTLAGMIGLGYLPSGSEDPFALRRATNGIIRILLDKGYRLSLAEFAGKALAPLYPKFKEKDEVVRKKLLDFLRNRLSAYFSRGEESPDLVEAVLSAQEGLGWEDPVYARARLMALSRFDENPETFEPATTTFSRVANIIRQAGGASERDYSEALIADEAERELTDAYCLTAPAVLDILESHKDEPRSEPGVLEADFAKYMEMMMKLRPVVDTFFDKVLVMAEDEKIRKHRLGLLAKVAALFAPVADFAKIRSRRQSD